MHKLIFYPINNANCILIELDNGQLILFDYANPGDPQNDKDKRIDTASEIKALLKEKNRNNIDIVAFTHIDLDHIGGASELFYLQHAQKYQSDARIKIDNLWIPAGVILEERTEDEARIIRGDTYRAVYTVKFTGIIYVLHAFQKKSKKGISTPKQDIDLIKKRLQQAKDDYQQLSN